MSSIGNVEGSRTARSLLRTLLVCAALAGLAPAAAWAVPETRALSSDAAALRGALDAEIPSISLEPPNVDRVTIQVIGLAVDSIDPAELDLEEPIARPLERAMALPALGTTTTPSPEHLLAVVFAVGLAMLGHRLNRFPPIEPDEALL